MIPVKVYPDYIVISEIIFIHKNYAINLLNKYSKMYTE